MLALKSENVTTSVRLIKEKWQIIGWVPQGMVGFAQKPYSVLV